MKTPPPPVAALLATFFASATVFAATITQTVNSSSDSVTWNGAVWGSPAAAPAAGNAYIADGSVTPSLRTGNYANSTFLGDSLTMRNGSTLVVKTTNVTANLILESDAGIGMSENGTDIITPSSNIQVAAAQSAVFSSGDSGRTLVIDALVSGTGSLTIDQTTATSGYTGEIRVRNTANTFSGTWTVNGGVLAGEGIGALGASHFIVNANGTLDLRSNFGTPSTTSTLTLNTGGRLDLSNGCNHTFAAVTLGGVSLPSGTYTYSALTPAQQAYFIAGSDTFTVLGGDASATIVIDAATVVRDIPAGLGGVCLSKFWAGSSPVPDFRGEFMRARIGLARIASYPADNGAAVGTVAELDTLVAQIINAGAVPLFIQCIESESNSYYKNALLRLDGTLYPAGDPAPINQRVATNLTYLVNRYKSPPFNLSTQYWEIGNEPDLGPLPSYKVSSPAEYNAFFSLAHTQLQASGLRGNVILCGPVLSYDYGYNVDRDTLMREFLSACGGQVDIVTRHIYAAINSWETTDYSRQSLLNHLKKTLHFNSAQTGTGGRGESALLAKMNELFVPSTVGTGVTEMNLFANADGSDYVHEITQGLWFLLVDHYTLYNPRTRLTTGFGVFNRSTDRLSYFYNGVPSQPYWAAYIQGVLNGDRVLAQTSSHSRLVATATVDDSYLYVRVINRDETTPLAATVSIANAPAVSAPERFILSATQIPDTGTPTALGTTFIETFPPFTATVFRYPRLDAPVPPSPPAPPATIHLATSFDTASPTPSGMTTHYSGFQPVVASGRLQLTSAGSANSTSAAVFAGQPLPLATTRAQIRYGFLVSTDYMEGFVFGAYSANPAAVGTGGASLGYHGQPHRLWGVKIDNNPNQLAVVSSVTDSVVEGWATQPLAVYANQNRFMVVDYDGEAGTVRARLYQGTDDTAPLLADVTNRLGNPSALPAGTVFGFTGSTGSFSQSTYIENLTVLIDEFIVGQETLLDNSDATGVVKSSGWVDSATTPGYLGTNYCHDNNTAKGSRTITYTPSLVGFGPRDVYVRWTAATNRATNTRYLIQHAGGTATVLKDQRSSGSQWVKLGTWSFAHGTSGNVVVSNESTDGYVIADGVRFVNVAP